MSTLQEIQNRLSKTANQVGRVVGSVQLLAVSKTKTPEQILPILLEGHRQFGENRVQEAVSKWPNLKAQFPDTVLHLIGPLQTNKVKQAFAHFDVIQSVDRQRLADKIATEAQIKGTCPQLFIQVNTGEEPQKAGVLPQDADTFIADCRAKSLPIVGLMAIPPANEDSAPHFAFLKTLADRNGIEALSMGMSNDFELAIEHGATMVRVGSALFGARAYPDNQTNIN